ncbi:MAG: AAA family ATPase [Bacteroidales bacterium]|nr:AAA family ATPase [Bacteroidales bacterium]
MRPPTSRGAAQYDNWSTELKNIYDGQPTLKVVFTGSSVLDLLKGQADLSRRTVIYSMQGLSFHEYLEMHHGIKMPKYKLADVVDNKVDGTILPHPLPLFRQYLQDGYYPFSKEGAFASGSPYPCGLSAYSIDNDLPLKRHPRLGSEASETWVLLYGERSTA